MIAVALYTPLLGFATGAADGTQPRLICNSPPQLKKPRRCRNPLVAAGVYSAKGPRPNNEDAALAVIYRQDKQIYSLAAVADGVGGLRKGEVASHVAVCRLAEVFISHVTRGAARTTQWRTWIKDAIDAVHRAVVEKAGGGATTLTVAIYDGQLLHVANVGDSPAYLDGGIVTTELDEQGSYITQALGHRSYTAPHYYSRPLHAKRHEVVLVTDGVDDVLKKEGKELYKTPAKTPLCKACRLVNTALARGGRDNATAAVMWIYHPGTVD
ncbi:protein phosphatase 2C domain-containing protein [Pyrobaculum sp. 3827-6]|uniref:PP2C family protein-serine/threonine phosphatase n=1 Tax=Pyrobaculum sp. 3827-6 TaxID=2983604 RepID=UPI0021D85457|nr:PP2C family serine/threonine-protein phosphatase [Pyrobaculum sp. 3827-6]MCU7786707.1 protein phosphatase 2C domain-containing protein [Pyrobaculum sp. 3827-6]